MAERLSDRLNEFLKNAEGKDVSLSYLRNELHIDPSSSAHDGIRVLMHNLIDKRIVKPSGKNDGVYHVIKQVKPVQVFGKERRPPVILCFPRDFDTGEEMLFAEDIVLREGDLILLAGRSNFGKTTLCMNFCGENIEAHPTLMGNEYTTLENEPSSRFLNRLDAMDWVEWADKDGNDKFVLLPVRADYAEHIMKDKINIIDWINIDTGEHYMIGSVMEAIKKELGKGIGIIAIQKAEGAEAGRGGQFTKDFADCELLLDKLGETDEVVLTIGKVKESKKRVSGRTFAYGIAQGVKIINFREIRKCPTCFGKGWQDKKPCQTCDKIGYIDK
ncbi:MAG: hypothetical protein WC479_05975 [Candidatus Izemoplasmatales bacterium]